MTIPVFSQGIPDGSQLLKPVFSDGRFEMVNMDSATKHNCPLPYLGVKLNGTGTNTAAKPPMSLQSGVFLNITASTTGAGTGYGETNPFNTGASLVHGSNFFDIAADAAGMPYMIFLPYGNGSIENAGMYITDVDGAATATNNPSYDPGTFTPETTTGLRGRFKAWVPRALLSEAPGSTAGYTAGATVTILNGRPKLAASGNKEIGMVELTSSLAVLIEFNLVPNLPTKA